MASRCNRFISRASLSTLKSAIRSTTHSSSAPKSAAPSFPNLRSNPTSVSKFNFSRIPSELGCVQSLMPLHSVVAAARMTSCLSTTSRSCRALLQGTLCSTSPGL